MLRERSLECIYGVLTDGHGLESWRILSSMRRGLSTGSLARLGFSGVRDTHARILYLYVHITCIYHACIRPEHRERDTMPTGGRTVPALQASPPIRLSEHRAWKAERIVLNAGQRYVMQCTVPPVRMFGALQLQFCVQSCSTIIIVIRVLIRIIIVRVAVIIITVVRVITRAVLVWIVVIGMVAKAVMVWIIMI